MHSIRRYSSFLSLHKLPSFPDTTNPPSVKTLLRSCNTTHHLLQVHALIIRRGLEQDHFIITDFINLSNTLSPNLSYPTSVFNRVSKPSTCLWNCLIKGYGQKGCFVDILSVYVRMRREGAAPDKYTYPLLVKACSDVSKVREKEGEAIHGSVIRSGVEEDIYVSTSLIDMYGKFEKIRCARKVFDSMTVRNVVSWTAMIVGYVNVGDIVKAKNLFDDMPQRNVPSWNGIIRGYVKAGDLMGARCLFSAMPDKNVVSFTTMIDGYAKAGDMVSARFLFEQTLDKDVVAWSALISGYAQNGQPTEAVKVFLEMESRAVKPDEFVLVSLMSACSQLGSLEFAQWLDSYVTQSSIQHQNVHVNAALVDMNVKCGNVERARQLFDSMERHDLISYCAMIQGLSIHGREAEAISLFDRMLIEGLIPDKAVFTTVLTACSHAGLVREGWKIFKLMKYKYCIDPSPDHFACMVDLLSRTGNLQDAYKLIKSMPVEPHAGAWGALLGACKLHCNSELGEVVASRLFELEPHNAGNYVLLSNIYAAAERWVDVSLLRHKMRERGVRKIPGLSRIHS